SEVALIKSYPHFFLRVALDSPYSGRHSPLSYYKAASVVGHEWLGANAMALTRISRWCSVSAVILVACIPGLLQAQSAAQKFIGMWSDPPDTITGVFCGGWCTDAGIDRLNALLDDPANDVRPIQQVQAEANTYQIDQYVRPRLTNSALKNYP